MLRSGNIEEKAQSGGRQGIEGHMAPSPVEMTLARNATWPDPEAKPPGLEDTKGRHLGPLGAQLTHTLLPEISGRYLTTVIEGGEIARVHIAVTDGEFGYEFA